MTNLEFGITGAKRTSIEKDDPIKLLWDIRESHPSAGAGELLRKFTEAVKDDPDMLDVVIAYTFACLQHRIEHPKRGVGARRHNHGIAERMRENLQKHIVKKAEELLMDMTMPNGKRLGDCTIAYCAKLGGWMSRLAKGKNPRQMVSFVYTEEDLKQLRKG
jgi:hypothetical protein